MDPGNRAIAKTSKRKSQNNICTPSLASSQSKLEQKDRGPWDRVLQGEDGTDQLGFEHSERSLLCVWNIWKKTALVLRKLNN